MMAAYLWHLAKGEKDKAFGIFETKDAVKRAIDKSDDIKFIRARAAEIVSVDFIGYRLISTDIISLLYIVMTREGPVVIRVDSYTYEKKFNIVQIRTARRWDDLMRLVDSVPELPASIEFKMQPKSDTTTQPKPPKDVKPSKTSA